MSTIDSSSPYPEADRYWDIVKRTLGDVFKESPDPADVLRREMSQSSAEEQLQFYHAEPLDVAADLAGRRPDKKQIKAYRKLADAADWRLL